MASTEMNGRMHINVVIISYRNPGDVIDCLGALGRQSYQDFSVWICENGGQDAAKELAARLPAELPNAAKVHLIAAPDNPGYAGGINLCIERSPAADAYWILNPDTRPDPDALAAMVAMMATGGYDAVGGVIYRSDGNIQTAGGTWAPWAARATSIAMGQSKAAPPAIADVTARLAFISGASMLVSRAFVVTTGPMRAEYFLYAEELEWCVRASQRGLSLGYAPTALVWHAHGASTGSGQAKASKPKLPIYLDERNKLLTVRDTTPVWLLTAIPMAFLLLTLRYARPASLAQWGYAIQGWWAGVCNRRGKPDFISG